MLLRSGVKQGDVIAIAAEKTAETIASLLSVVRCGAAYMPVDISYPPDRLRFMLSDTNCRLLLCSPEQQEHKQTLVSSRVEVLVVKPEDLSHAEVNMEEARRVHKARPEDPAAIIFTSGSTGVPKGVEISQGALLAQNLAMNQSRPLSSSDRIVQQTMLTFDVAGNEIWSSFFFRSTLVIVDDATRLLGFENFLLRNAISVLFITPSHLALLSPPACGKSLKTLVLAGEALPPSLSDRWASQGRALLNEYGPTETNVVTSCKDYPCSKFPSSATSIGRPLPGVVALVLDRHMRLSPVGVPGELCIGGDQLASSYWNRPDLTSSKFADCKLLGEGGAGQQSRRVYRTGDLCRWLPDGKIEYLGRMDNQIKIRGMRVEIGEIESKISEEEDVSQTAVVLLQDKGVSTLAAAVVLRGKTWEEEKVVERLSASLPQHMIPSLFVCLEALPTTTSGKIDRKKL
ncbi:hypothetical protein GUITHDRAFT_70685, partial [Guillardia theta CCMP2712]